MGLLSFNSLRISQPELIYPDLEPLVPPQAKIAIGGLVDILGMSVEATRRLDRSVLTGISEVMRLHQTSTELEAIREPVAIGNRVLELVTEYPWLQTLPSSVRPPREGGQITVDQFFGWSHDHIFDDYPGLFGITEQEGKRLRGWATGARIDDTEYAVTRALDYDLWP